MSTWIDQLFEFGMADLFNQQTVKMAPDFAVCAGDPVCLPSENEGLIKISPSLKNDMAQFVIDGYSMSAHDVEDGDNILASRLNGHYESIQEGDLLVVKVDPDYYNNETPRYKYKLRCAIMIVEEDWNEETIISRLKEMESQPEIMLERFQKCLYAKYRKARNHYPAGRLMLSSTYKNGILQYSFHRLDFIVYKAEILIKEDNPGKPVYLSAA